MAIPSQHRCLQQSEPAQFFVALKDLGKIGRGGGEEAASSPPSLLSWVDALHRGLQAACLGPEMSREVGQKQRRQDSAAGTWCLLVSVGTCQCQVPKNIFFYILLQQQWVSSTCACVHCWHKACWHKILLAHRITLKYRFGTT